MGGKGARSARALRARSARGARALRAERAEDRRSPNIPLFHLHIPLNFVLLNGSLKTLLRSIRGLLWKVTFSRFGTAEMVLFPRALLGRVPPRRCQRKIARATGPVFVPKREFISSPNALVGI